MSKLTERWQVERVEYVLGADDGRYRIEVTRSLHPDSPGRWQALVAKEDEKGIMQPLFPKVPTIANKLSEEGCLEEALAELEQRIQAALARAFS